MQEQIDAKIEKEIEGLRLKKAELQNLVKKTSREKLESHEM